jgi:hypothetical protein
VPDVPEAMYINIAYDTGISHPWHSVTSKHLISKANNCSCDVFFQGLKGGNHLVSPAGKDSVA